MIAGYALKRALRFLFRGKIFPDPLVGEPFREPAYFNHSMFKTGTLYHIDLARYLLAFLREGVDPKKIDPAFYEVRLDGGAGSYDSRFGVIYRDAHYTFILVKLDHRRTSASNGVLGSALAAIGFDLDEDIDKSETTLIVKQIQGVRGCAAKLAPFRWEKMLLRVVIDWAKSQGIRTVKVTPAEKNQYYSKDIEGQEDRNYERKKRREALFMKYDVTARRMGFRFDPKEEMYVMNFA